MIIATSRRSARLDYQLTENASLKGIFHYINSDAGLFNNNNFASTADPNARQATTQYVGKLEWEQKILANWDYRISGSIYKEHDKFTDDVDSCVFFGFPCDSRTRDIFRPQTASGEFQTNYRLEDWSTSTFGVQYNRRSASTSGGIDEAIGNVGYYLQQQFQFLDRSLIMIPGIRLDDNQQFGTAWTPSFSAAYLFKEIGTKLKGGYAKGFRAPTLNELFFPAGFGCPAFGNPDLGPEKSWEINFGVEQNFLAERIKIGGNYFHREVKDLIEARPIPGDPFGCFRAENVGHARFDGVELTLGIRLFEGLTLNANYTYLDWDTADGTLPRRPHNSGNVILNRSPPRRRWNSLRLASIGGVINIITKRGQGPLDVGVSAQGGNGWTNRQVATLRGGVGNLGYAFSVGHIGSQGFRSVNDDYRNLSTSARLDYQLTENASLKGIFHFINSDVGLFNNNNFASTADPNARQATTQYVGKLEWEQKILANWDYRISGSMFKEHDKFTDDVDSCVFFGFPCDSRTRDIFRPQIASGEFQTNYRLEDWSTSTFGVQYNRRSASTNGGIDEAIGNVGYYLQQQFQFLDRSLIMIPGIRLDDNQQFGTAWTPSFSAAYLFKEIGTKLKGGYAKRF